jgi:hypothetical protein
MASSSLGDYTGINLIVSLLSLILFRRLYFTNHASKYPDEFDSDSSLMTLSSVEFTFKQSRSYYKLIYLQIFLTCYCVLINDYPFQYD